MITGLRAPRFLLANWTLNNQSQDIAGLNTDLSSANTTVDPFDIDELRAKQESAAALAALLNIAVGDISSKLGFDQGSAERIASLAAEAALVHHNRFISATMKALGYPGRKTLAACLEWLALRRYT
jgi:hypothetical protein